jgi:ketosteroid isomerase-like protein
MGSPPGRARRGRGSAQLSARTEAIREAFAAINRGDFEAAAANLAPNVELQAPSDPERPLQGAEAVVEWLRPDFFDQQHYEIRELHESGDRIFVELDVTARGRGSGVELRQRAWSVYEFDGVLARRITTFRERASALEAAGLAD